MLGPDEYGKRALDFIERVQNLTDYAAICTAIAEEFKWFGLPYVTIFDMPSPGVDRADCVLFNNRPADYTAHYVSDNLVECDPVVAEHYYSKDPYSWGDIRQRRKLSKKQKRLMDEAREFDSKDGFVVPVIPTIGSQSLVCPCGPDPDLSAHARSAIELISIYAQQMLHKARLRGAQKANQQPLTAREREVMHWVALGKTDDEIGEILTISRTTVSYHVENAKLKLNASRRTYAVIQALRFGELSL